MRRASAPPPPIQNTSRYVFNNPSVFSDKFQTGKSLKDFGTSKSKRKIIFRNVQVFSRYKLLYSENLRTVFKIEVKHSEVSDTQLKNSLTTRS